MPETDLTMPKNRPAVLLVEDDENDYSLLELSCRRAGMEIGIQWVKDGDQAIGYLSGAGEYADRARYPFPALVLIDLRRPGSSGFEVLKWIRLQPELHPLLVWVYSGSLEAADATKAYSLDANAYIVKPNGLQEWTELTRTLQLWVSRCPLPSAQPAQVPRE